MVKRFRTILIAYALICSGFAWSQSSPDGQQHVIVHPVLKPEQCDSPDWPSLTLKWEQEGIVQVAGLVDTDGKIIRSAIRHSSGYPKLDAAAETAFLGCSFNPGTIDGKAVRMLFIQTYIWVNSNGKNFGPGWTRIIRKANEGDVAALYTMAIWQSGNPDTRSDGLTIFQVLAEAGHTQSQLELGTYFELGLSVEKNIEQAEIWYTKAAPQDPIAAERLKFLRMSHSL